ncbi:hypothetical protein EV363DRAFT_1104979, partial [Boletus edulis]
LRTTQNHVRVLPQSKAVAKREIYSRAKATNHTIFSRSPHTRALLAIDDSLSSNRF